MSYVDKTFTFDSSLESWTGVPASEVVMTRETGDGSPGTGCLSAYLAGKNKNPGNSYWEWVGTFEDLGVPASSIVTAIGTDPNNDYNWRCSVYVTGSDGNCYSGALEIWDNVTPAIIGTIVSAQGGVSGTTSWAAANGSEVSLSSLPSNTTIRLRLNVTIRTGNSNSAEVAILQDQVVLRITYTAPTTLAPTTIPTTLAPTTIPTTLAPTTIPTTLAPTTIPTTLAPTTIPTTLAPTTLAPTTHPPCWADDYFTGTDNDPPDPTKWFKSGSPDIQSNTLEMTYNGGYEEVLHKALFGTSFDIQIDFSIQSGDANSWDCSFYIWLDATHAIYIEVSYTGGARIFYSAYKNGGGWTYDNDPRTNNTGGLRIVRSGSSFTTYYKDGAGDWTALQSAVTVGAGTENARLYIYNGNWDTNPTITCRWDNFLVNDGCPPSLLTTTPPTTLAPTTIPTTLAPTTIPTTLAPTTIPTTLAPTTIPTTLAPTTIPTTLAPTTIPTTLAPTTLPTTLAPTTEEPENDFSCDPHCEAWYRFESGNLDIDETDNNNDLTSAGTPTADADHMEGDTSVLLDATGEHLYRTDANLSQYFPFKSTASRRQMTICGWFKTTTISDVAQPVVSKYDNGSPGKRSWMLYANYAVLKFVIGYNNGAQDELLWSQTISTNRWYHVGLTYDAVSKNWSVVLWDDTAQSEILNSNGTGTQQITITDAPFAVGSYYKNGATYNEWSGRIDELVVFNDILSDADIVLIRQQTYDSCSWLTTDPPTSATPTTPEPTTPAPTSLAPTTVPTTLAPTTIPTTLAPTTIPTTLAPTTIPTTLAPTTIPTTLAPTTIPTTLAPTTIPTTLAPTTLATSLAPTTFYETPCAHSENVWSDTADGATLNLRSYRNVINVSDPGGTVERIRVRFASGSSYGTYITGASIGNRDAGIGYVVGEYDRLTFDGANDVLIGTDDSVWSDWIDISWFDHNNDILVHFDLGSAGNAYDPVYCLSGNVYRKSGELSDAMVQAPAGYSLVAYWNGILDVEVCMAATTAPPTSLAPTTIPTTLAPTTLPTTLAPTTIPTTLAPTTIPTTLAPTTVPTTLAPTTIPTTLAPTTTCDLDETDFSEYTSDLPPGDWTEQWVTTAATDYIRDVNNCFGCKALEIVAVSASRYAVSWDDVGTPADVEILARMRVTTNTNPRLYLRGGGAIASEDAYFCYMQPGSDVIGIHKYVAGASTSVNSTSKTIDVDVWYWVRFRAKGESLKLKVWAGAYSDEPGAWDLDETDSDLSSGWVGVGQSQTSHTAQYDIFYVAAGGCSPNDPPTNTPAPCTTEAPTTLPTTLAPTTIPTTLAPTTLPTTLAPTTIPTTLAPTTLPTTLAPTTVPTTLAPTTVPTTVAPTTIPTTLAPTTVPTTLAPTTLPTTLGPTTIVTTLAPTTTLTTAVPTTAPPTVICEKMFISTINNPILLGSAINNELFAKSTINREIALDGNLCG